MKPYVALVASGLARPDVAPDAGLSAARSWVDAARRRAHAPRPRLRASRRVSRSPLSRTRVAAQTSDALASRSRHVSVMCKFANIKHFHAPATAKHTHMHPHSTVYTGVLPVDRAPPRRGEGDLLTRTQRYNESTTYNRKESTRAAQHVYAQRGF